MPDHEKAEMIFANTEVVLYHWYPSSRMETSYIMSRSTRLRRETQVANNLKPCSLAIDRAYSPCMRCPFVQSLGRMHFALVSMLCVSFFTFCTLLPVARTLGRASGFADAAPGNDKLLLAQGATLSRSPNGTTGVAGIIPADRVTTWNPGLNAVGGIPNRTTIYRTLTPSGGSLDDTSAIQSALDACPPGQVVKLSPGTFNINGGGVHFKRTNCILRGSGTGV